MKSRFLNHTTILLLLPLLLVICWLFSTRDVITAQMRAVRSQGCSPNSFFGVWSTPNHDGSLQIATVNNGVRGTVMAQGAILKIMNGAISGYSFNGSWYDYVPEGGRGGNFTAKLDPDGRIDVTFYVNNSPVESGVWFCSSGQPPPPPPTYTPTPDITPTPTPTPRPPGAWMIRDDQDQDNFETFDSLPPGEQALVLTRRGPRQRVEYDADNIGMRILVTNGAPLVIDYALDSNRPAELTVEIPDGRPVSALLEPRPRATFSVPLRVRSGDPVVAKVTIDASAREEGEGLQLFGISVGERGREALRKADHDVQLAFASFSEHTAEPYSLFSRARDALSLRIDVGLPATLKVKQKPEQKINFSCTCSSDFTDGRWEWWRVAGLHWTKVWQHGTKSLSRNQTISEDWNGIITSRKLVSPGSHALEMTAWQKSGNDRDSIVVWAPSRLTVTE